MNNNLTDITIVLDRSGSMGVIRDDTIGGVNRFIADQKTGPGAATFTLNQFDHEFETVIDAKPITEAQPLTAKTYVPRGSTALLDAIGRSITATGARLEKIPEADRPGKVVFTIVTDGHENRSREFTRAKVFDMIKHQQDKYGWQFVFLGANQNAISEATNYGISAANAMTFASNTVGTQCSYDSFTANVKAFRMGSKRDMSFEAKDYQAQAQAGVDPDLNKPKP